MFEGYVFDVEIPKAHIQQRLLHKISQFPPNFLVWRRTISAEFWANGDLLKKVMAGNAFQKN